ncbi:hypothetical protein Cabys_605 [Caldithrix abyssi DSM 13497]|uniref:Uncharacterized protein n=1 Tax=Caldithrix abyssi DSM 13497 TaxID=880073 RepID=A0A1J1C4M0_CALAY|nr:hypothetical protein Cabys_605 [Caldithrix abyssi DSM 13497]
MRKLLNLKDCVRPQAKNFVKTKINNLMEIHKILNGLFALIDKRF